MKRFITLYVVALCAISCSSYTYTPTATAPAAPVRSRLLNTATYRSISVDTPVTPPLIADLNVSSTKISFTLGVTQELLRTDIENMISAAVKEALLKNNNADVLIGMEYQIKYNNNGVIESISVTGYPATYKNFRHPSESVWLHEGVFIKDVNDAKSK